MPRVRSRHLWAQQTDDHLITKSVTQFPGLCTSHAIGVVMNATPTNRNRPPLNNTNRTADRQTVSSCKEILQTSRVRLSSTSIIVRSGVERSKTKIHPVTDMDHDVRCIGYAATLNTPTALPPDILLSIPYDPICNTIRYNAPSQGNLP